MVRDHEARSFALALLLIVLISYILYFTLFSQVILGQQGYVRSHPMGACSYTGDFNTGYSEDLMRCPNR